MKPGLTWLDAVSAVVVAAMFGVAAWVGLQGPTTPIPIHFDINGQADNWAPREQVGWMIAGLAAMAALVLVGMGRAARRAEDAARRRSLLAGQVVSLVSFAAVTALIISPVLVDGEPPAFMKMAGIGLLFALIGAFLGRVGPNVAVGVRTPWNYKSKLAWERSNRLAGRLLFWTGLASLAAAPFAPQPTGMHIQFAALMLIVAWSVIESWRVWRTDPDRQPF